MRPNELTEGQRFRFYEGKGWKQVLIKPRNIAEMSDDSPVEMYEVPTGKFFEAVINEGLPWDAGALSCLYIRVLLWRWKSTPRP